MVAGVIRAEEIRYDEPVVTKCYKQVFGYETCSLTSTPLVLKPCTIVSLRLELEVAFADEQTREGFIAMKSNMESDCKV